MFNDIIISTNDQLANQFKHDNVIIDDANNKKRATCRYSYCNETIQR